MMGYFQFNADEIIIFNTILSNIGNGYNVTTGIFSAPHNGTYTFMTLTMATEGEH